MPAQTGAGYALLAACTITNPELVTTVAHVNGSAIEIAAFASKDAVYGDDLRITDSCTTQFLQQYITLIPEREYFYYENAS